MLATSRDSFTQNYTGSFSVMLRPNTPHCGPRSSTCPICETFSVRVRISFPGDALDANGFLLDNTWFSQYFASFEGCQIGISCERVACLLASDIYSATENRAKSVTVSIKPVQGVWLSCTHKAA